MMYPILCKVRFETLHHSLREKQLWVQVAFSIVVNWLIAPLFMVLSLHTASDACADPNYSLLLLGHFFLTSQHYARVLSW